MAHLRGRSSRRRWRRLAKLAPPTNLSFIRAGVRPPNSYCAFTKCRYNSGMPDSGLWFERKFEFAFSTDLFPNLCVRLRGTPPRLEEMLRGRPRDVLITRQGEKWTILEQAGHL